VDIVAEVLKNCYDNNAFDTPIDDWAKQYSISTRTLQRYFEGATSISSKQALQTMRIRKAVTHLFYTPHTFDYTLYGYYDNSHFYKHLKQFFGPQYFKQYQRAVLTQQSLQSAPGL
jgi:transcriptional regulator GlxA family with amidase domain